MRVTLLMASFASLLITPALAQVAASAPAVPAAPAPAAPAPDAAVVPAVPVAGPVAINPANVLDLDLSTGGTVRILLRPDKAPESVNRIRTLAQRGFYDGLAFHRVIEGFMAQTGDPKGDGTGGSELPDVKAEFNDMPHVRGVMAMARSEAIDSANSQFFIMLAPNLKLDGRYTPIGRVISGMQFVDLIARGEPPETPSRIVRARFEAEAPILPPGQAGTPAPVAAPGASAADDPLKAAVKDVMSGKTEDMKPKK